MSLPFVLPPITEGGAIPSLKTKGFKIKKRSHLDVFLYPGFWLVKKRNKRFVSSCNITERKKVDTAIRKTSQNKLLNWIMLLELWVGKFLSYPTGIRCVVSCTKEVSTK